MGNVVISLMRNIIPSKIRIIVQLIVVATLVIIVDQVLKAFAYELSKTLVGIRWAYYYQLYYYGTF